MKQSSYPYLETLIKRADHTLLEWLQMASVSGVVLPDKQRQALAVLACERPEYRSAVISVLGDTGTMATSRPGMEWLAPDIAFGTDIEAAWHKSKIQSKRELLIWLHRSQPERARQLLLAQWQSVPPKEKPVLLTAIEASLSRDDETFLRQVIGDGQYKIRLQAAQLLVSIPGSSLGQAMFDRLLTSWSLPEGSSRLVFDWKKGFWPQEFQRFVDPGVRDWVQMLGLAALVKPWLWAEHFGISPERLILSLLDERSPYREYELGVDLIKVWADAAYLHKDMSFIRALCKHAYEDVPCLRERPLSIDIKRLFVLLSPEEREDLALEMIDHNSGKLCFAPPSPKEGMPQPVLAVLKYCEHVWSKPFSTRILAQLKEEISVEHEHFNWSMRFVLPQTAQFLSTSVLEEAEAGWLLDDGPVWDGLKKPFAAYLDTIALRKAYIADLAQHSLN